MIYEDFSEVFNELLWHISLYPDMCEFLEKNLQCTWGKYEIVWILWTDKLICIKLLKDCATECGSYPVGCASQQRWYQR